MSETNEKSVEQRLAELEQYVNDRSSSSPAAAADTYTGVAVEIFGYTIPLAPPEMLALGAGLFLQVSLAVWFGRSMRRERR